MINISFIIPIFNCVSSLQNCVDSIRNVGVNSYEILLIDDGSTDGSSALCDTLVQSDSRIRTIHQQNAGVSVARNRGIQEAKGEYILFVDADDVLLPFDESMVDNLRENPDMIMFGMVFSYYHNDTWVKDEEKVIREVNRYTPATAADAFEHLFSNNYFSPVWNKLLKRSVLIDNGLMFDERLTNYEDLAFSLYTASKCKTIVAVPKPYYVYRVDYDHDKTVDRIARIQDVMGNTGLVAEAFLAFEQAAADAGAEDTKQIWACLRNVYFELFYTKMQTTAFSEISKHCRAFLNDQYADKCLKMLELKSESQKRWYRWIETENASGIWLYVRYLRIRHYVARNLKRMAGWRL